MNEPKKLILLIFRKDGVISYKVGRLKVDYKISLVDNHIMILEPIN